MNELLCYAMTMPGLETVAFSEVRAQLPDAKLVKFSRGVVLFTTAKPQAMMGLRTTEDVYIALAHITKLGRQVDALRVLHSATLGANVNDPLTVWRRLHNGGPPGTWRVVSQKEGTHDFRRMDAGQAIIDALKKTLPPKMHLVEDDADVEFWLWLHGSEAIIGMRLSDATMRHRTYKLEHIPASLRPTVAATMCWLSQPTANDAVVDPLCGAGTILVERGLMGPYTALSGGDIRSEVVTLARKNTQSAHVPIELQQWDAQQLPLETGSQTHIITNLPFGKQVGALASNAELYPALATEFKRILAPKGTIVTLTSDDRLWDATLRDAGWTIQKKVVMVVLGQPASIFVAQPRA